jgi:hypothetical protein
LRLTVDWFSEPPGITSVQLKKLLDGQTSSGGYFSVRRVFRFRSISSSWNCFRSDELFRGWNLLQFENIPGLFLSRESDNIEELLPFYQRTPVEDSSLSGGFPWIVSVPVEVRGFRGIASFSACGFLWKVNCPRNSEGGCDLIHSPDFSGIAPVKIRQMRLIKPRSEGISVEMRCSRWEFQKN